MIVSKAHRWPQKKPNLVKNFKYIKTNDHFVALQIYSLLSTILDRT